MSFKPVNPKEEVDKIYQRIQYENSNLYLEEKIVSKVIQILSGRSPKSISPLWYSILPVGNRIMERGFKYTYEVKGTVIELYVDTLNSYVYFFVSQYVGTKMLTRNMVIKESKTFKLLWDFLSDQEKEYTKRESLIEDILDDLLKEE